MDRNAGLCAAGRGLRALPWGIPFKTELCGYETWISLHPEKTRESRTRGDGNRATSEVGCGGWHLFGDLWPSFVFSDRYRKILLLNDLAASGLFLGSQNIGTKRVIRKIFQNKELGFDLHPCVVRSFQSEEAPSHMVPVFLFWLV